MRQYIIFQYLRNIALTILLGMTLVSCSDFLNIKPRDIVTEDNFWNERTDIDQFVAGCYTAMQSEAFISRCIVWGEVRSDNLFPGPYVESGSYDLYQILRENLLSTNSYTRWVDFYHVIDKCNSVIRMASEVSAKDPSYRDSDVKATIAEMTALRSLCYFYLIRAFEAVPFYREAIQQESEVLYLPASSFDYILGEIIKDLESVKNDALVHYATSDNDGVGKNYNSSCNRITRTSITAMLADMYLWQGNYDKTIECAEEIIAQKRKDYKEQFSNSTSMRNSGPQEVTGRFGRTVPLYVNTVSDLSNSFDAIFGIGNSFESVFELSYNYTSSNTNYVMSTALGRLYGAGITQEIGGLKPNSGIGFLAVNPSMVSEVKDKSFSYFIHEYDVRFYNSFRATDDQYGEGFVRKGVASTFNIQQNSGSTASTVPYNNYSASAFLLPGYMNRNWIFYRLTDVMLMEAEALLMKTTDEDTPENTELLHQAFDLIYLVHYRSLVNPSKDLSFNSYKNRGTMQKLLREERNRELMYEGKRWFDLVRYARRDGQPDVVRATVPGKLSSESGANRFSSMESLYWPYNKDELKVDTLLHQKAIYSKEGGEEYEMN
ncbi:MAG: RagB/SusD family nutrient uptake outer membrane protein [Bacteroidaceae bacterium]|nr:RagB/SusD family nutrient uptake outer membrane protein [Bacteroidaceae bacterium]